MDGDWRCDRKVLAGLVLLGVLSGTAGGLAAGDGLVAGSEGRAPRTKEGAVNETAEDGAPRRLLFIHHSCGGQLLAEPGEQVGGERGSGERCIYRSHPNGGGLRRLLTEAGYEVHEASYGSLIGENTDIGDWPRLFGEHMQEVLACDRNDRFYQDGRRNEIVLFKSCFPNNDFTGPGKEPGDPTVPELTVANARAAYRELLPRFADRPGVLFVAFTAPPLARPRPEGLLDRLAALFGREPESARWAREFNRWLADRESGWLADYDLPNVVVFDYFDILTGEGESGWSAYPTRGGSDSHPSREGNRLTARAFVPFLERAVRNLEAAR